ncbi:MAG: DUF4974 domain-containing protein [Bacteroidales bacterium]|nr:DUF4974 domain-containing protein [Bacteroidales bacterium]
MNLNIISELIAKSVAGTISDLEQISLDNWRKEDASNQELYERLSDINYLQNEYRKWNSIDPKQPMKNMQRRIAGKKKNRRILLHSCAAAVVVLLLGSLLTLLYRSEQRYDKLNSIYQTEKYMTAIHPGQTKAKLTTDDGKIIVLDSNKTNNEKVLNSIRKGEEQQVRRQREIKDRIAINNLEIPRGGEFHITLEDGTQVWLNAESSLKYPEHFDRKYRQVEVSGEAFFKVSKEEERPFNVKIDGQVICVHGTEFNVMSYGEDRYVYTTLVSGSISIQPDSATGSELILSPGHQAVFAKSDCSTVVKQVKTEVVTSWRNGMFVFEDQTLDQIMRQLSRWYDFSYEFSNKEVASTVFMGKVPRYATFGDVLEILEKSGNLTFEAKQNRIIISHK